MINWGSVLTASAGFIVGLIVKTMLDLRLALFVVKYFWWIPIRWLFRQKPVNLSGQWEHTWESGGSPAYVDPRDRHGHPKIRQFGSYCYADFYSQGKTYCFFGKIFGDYIVGEWFDLNDHAGYFGAFQLRIVDSKELDGLWIGHSKTSVAIRADKSVWTKLKG